MPALPDSLPVKRCYRCNEWPEVQECGQTVGIRCRTCGNMTIFASPESLAEARVVAATVWNEGYGKDDA